IAEDRITGIAVHIGARVVREAEPGTIVVSGTVRDLIVGADIGFHELGVRRLRGVPGMWRLFAVQPSPGVYQVKVGSGSPEPARATFRREGDFWTIAYSGRISRLKNTSGLAYIAHLLRNPNTEFHALELAANTDRARKVVAGSATPASAVVSERVRLNVTRAIRAAVDRIAANNADLGEHLGVSIKTGTFCSYMSDPRMLIRWDL